MLVAFQVSVVILRFSFTRPGYMCQDCAFGFAGEKCQTRERRVRRNALSLTRDEQNYYRDIILKSRTTRSDYVVQRNMFDIDPTEQYELHLSSTDTREAAESCGGGGVKGFLSDPPTF